MTLCQCVLIQNSTVVRLEHHRKSLLVLNLVLATSKSFYSLIHKSMLCFGWLGTGLPDNWQLLGLVNKVADPIALVDPDAVLRMKHVFESVPSRCVNTLILEGHS